MTKVMQMLNVEIWQPSITILKYLDQMLACLSR